MFIEAKDDGGSFLLTIQLLSVYDDNHGSFTLEHYHRYAFSGRNIKKHSNFVTIGVRGKLPDDRIFFNNTCICLDIMPQHDGETGKNGTTISCSACYGC